MKLLLGDLLDFTDDPSKTGLDAVRYLPDGALLIDDQGRIADRGAASDLQSKVSSSVPVYDYRGKLIIPGMIDTHVHYPQTPMIAAYGEQLLTWLTEHAFPTEEAFADYDHAAGVAETFLNELVRNGTTTALVFGTVHPQSVDAFFDKAQERNLRMICGKVMMDRNCPDALKDTAETSYAESKALIDKWHGKDRLQYAVTPRFAPTSTPEQLDACKRLLEEYPTVYMHTHTSENKKECEWVGELFPESSDYIDVYQQAGLLRRRSVLAHGIHLCDRELHALADHKCALAHCPTSNLFIGSGLFPLKRIREHNIHVGMGTDVGAGTSFSMLQTYNEAYKVQQLQGEKLSAYEGLYLATLGGARALDLEGTIGQLETGCEADLVVLDPEATDLMRFRMQHLRSEDVHEKLFALMMLGDDRAIRATWIMGENQHNR
ncbi:guanine deaminase [Reinekea blandensis]|uniref:Guanine deaminase n=1 Tax=Reinekea blandensis MED297 TaxID=314283 RepID=A4BF60_9GAMM|nr:guanine deaminase [Reinekea blandensis]EAR09173.1 Cytosine deaminase and related metal-dependent Hydrolase [Reinekea sp. MED297] [Reinekea blandensis MED297]